MSRAVYAKGIDLLPELLLQGSWKDFRVVVMMLMMMMGVGSEARRSEAKRRIRTLLSGSDPDDPVRLT